MTTPSSATLKVAFFVVFLDLIGFGMLLPVQQFLARDYGADPWVITLLSASYSLMQFLFAPLWGSLSDRFGRRPVILISVGITALGHAAFALSTSLESLFLARCLAGFGAANLSTAQAIISDVTTPENRARGMGIVGAAFGLGFVFGPALGGMFSLWGGHAPAAAAAILSLVNLVFAYVALPETNSGKARSAHGFLALWSIQKFSTGLRRLFLLTLITTSAFALMEQSIGLLVQDTWVPIVSPTRLSDASWRTATFLVFVGLTSALIQGRYIGRLNKRYGEEKLMQVGLALMGATLCILPLLAATGSFPLFIAGAVTLALGTSLYNPSLSSSVSKSAPVHNQGLALSINQSSSALGRIFGPIVAGFLYQAHTSSPFIVGGVLIFVGLLTLPSHQHVETASSPDS